MTMQNTVSNSTSSVAHGNLFFSDRCLETALHAIIFWKLFVTELKFGK
jgi:hypothetical protein